MDTEVDSEIDSEINRDNDVEKFWNCIERKLAIIFPQYLRNILKLQGYDSAATVRAITQEDIDEKFEKFAKTKMIAYVPTDAKKEDYFYYFRKPELFYIIPGHKILLRQVVDSTKRMTEKYGIDYFNFYRPFDGPTNHVKPIRKRNLATQKSRQYLTTTVTTEHQSNPNTEQANLFEKIEVWLQKYKESSTSIKYTHPLCLASIDMAEEADENNIVKMVAMVPCPICGIKKRVAQVFTENTSPYMSLSNYQRHVRSHNGKDKEQEEKKVSSKRRSQSDQESEIKKSRKKRNVYQTGKGNEVLRCVDISEFPSESELKGKSDRKSNAHINQKRAATNKESEYKSVLSTKNKNNENSSISSNDSDTSQNTQAQAEVHQNPEKVLTKIPKKQNVRSAVLSTKSENSSTSSSDSDASQNTQAQAEVHQNPEKVLTKIPKKQNVRSAVLSTKSENSYTSSSDSDASQNTQEIRVVHADVHQNSDKVLTKIPKKQNVRSAVLSTKSENSSTSSSDSDTSQNIQEIRAADAYERGQKQSSRRKSSDSDSSASGKENHGNQNKAFTKSGNISPREKPESGKKKVYRKRSNMRSNFLITEAEESKNNEAETKTKDAKKNPKKPFNRFV